MVAPLSEATGGAGPENSVKLALNSRSGAPHPQCWALVAERQAFRIRQKYLEARNGPRQRLNTPDGCVSAAAELGTAARAPTVPASSVCPQALLRTEVAHYDIASSGQLVGSLVR